MKARLLGVLAAGLLAGSIASAAPVINEFSANTVGTDTYEYIEILGSPDTDYSGYWVLELEGDGTGAGVIDEVIQLGTTDANGLYLASLPANSLENGTLTLLLVDAFTGALNTDLDTNDDGILDAAPWTSIADCVGVNDGGSTDRNYCSVVLGVAYDGLAFVPGGASRIPNGVDTDTSPDWVRNDFDLAGISGYSGTLVAGEAYNTPGSANRAFGDSRPVSEPGTAALLGLAMAGLGWSRRRRER